MTKKKHHPQSRAERLALKELDEKTKIVHADKVRLKLLKESLKERETRDELEQGLSN
jgi:hypothetical protein